METLQVVIAERSQLVRMGLTGILYQTGCSLNIRETADADKLKIALKKEHVHLIIISKSFLHQCADEMIRQIQQRQKSCLLVLINDLPDVKNLLDYDDIIEFQDVERTIYRKLDGCMQKLSKYTHDSHQNDEISIREKEVLKLVALGMTNKEIAEKLFISAHTVITHRKNITAKLGIKTIAGLTVYALINKLIPSEEIQ